MNNRLKYNANLKKKKKKIKAKLETNKKMFFDLGYQPQDTNPYYNKEKKGKKNSNKRRSKANQQQSKPFKMLAIARQSLLVGG